MAMYRKLGKKTKLRKALLRNQVTALIYHGKITTTEARAKEIRKIVEPMITMAVKERDNFETVTKDAPSRLHARRQILRYLYPVVEVPQEAKGRKKNTKKVDLVDKMFTEYGPKYAGRNGGYTRIIKIGQRRGDGAMEVVLEFV